MMTKQNEVLPCIFAGDPDDEFCKDCNGVTMIVEELDNQELPATDCGGYTPPEIEEIQEEVQEEVVQAVEEPEQLQVEEQVPNKVQRDSEIVREQVASPTTNTITPQAVTKEIRAESGVTMEVKSNNGTSQWYKFGYTETRIVPEGADINFEKECLWTDVHNEVDNQVNQTLTALGIK